MSKIKDIIEKMKGNPKEYHDLSLLIVQRVWLIVATLYYVSLLFTVGGFYFGPITLSQLALMTFHLYSILVIASAWFFYALCEYAVAVYLPNRRWILIISALISIAFSTVILLVHLGILV